MTRIEIAKLLVKSFFLYLGLTLLVLALIPVAAGLAFAGRLVIPALLVAVTIGAAASATVRGWVAARLGGTSSW